MEVVALRKAKLLLRTYFDGLDAASEPGKELSQVSDENISALSWSEDSPDVFSFVMFHVLFGWLSFVFS